jgi:RNA polymerase sigma-70 factor (ECF subfamily)
MKTNQLSEDKELLSAIQRGDKEAFNTLFRKYYPILCTYCRRFVSIEDAEEIVQDIMLWLWEKRKEEVIQTSISQYLIRAVYHRALNKITQNETKNRADTFFYTEMSHLFDDTNDYTIEELEKNIKSAISQLPDSYKEAFTMHRFQQMSYKEIAEALNVSAKTVDYRIQQALKILRLKLKEYFC